MGTITQTIGFALGVLFGGWSVVTALVVALRALRQRIVRRRVLNRQQADLRDRIEATAHAARASYSIPNWEGWRRFRVAAITDESKDVKSFYLSPVDGRPLAPFATGQFLTFRLPLPDSDESLVRCYSLSEQPREDYFRCTIKRIGPPPNELTAPAGRGSSHFHDRVHLGDELDIRAPAGEFLLDPQGSDPIVLIGGGIGITPLLCMLNATARTGRRRPVHVLFGFNNGQEHPFREHLTKLAAEYPNVEIHTSYSDPEPNDVLYQDYNHTGWLTIDRVREVLPSNNFHFYICGPGPMMEALVPALLEWGVPESHIHFEAFGPASIKKLGAGKAAEAVTEPCEVRFETSGRDVIWDGTHGSLLEFGEGHGIALPSGCRAGSCGECMTAIQAGEVQILKKPAIPVPVGHCLTCVSVPAGPLVLEA